MNPFYKFILLTFFCQQLSCQESFIKESLPEVDLSGSMDHVIDIQHGSYIVESSGSAAPLGLRDYNGNTNQVLELVPENGGGAPSYHPGGQEGCRTQDGQGNPQGGQPQQAPKRLFHIASDLNGKVLDIKDGSTAPGAQVVMWYKHRQNANNQLWYTDAQGHILSELNDFSFFSQSSKDKITMKPHSPDPNRLWTLEGQQIQNGAGLCLDIWEGVLLDGADVIGFKCKGSINQRWKLQYV